MRILNRIFNIKLIVFPNWPLDTFLSNSYFFLFGYSFSDTESSQYSRKRERTIFFFSATFISLGTVKPLFAFFGFDIPVSYLWLKRMKLADLYPMRFIYLSELTFNRLLIAFCLLIWNILFIFQQKNRIWTHFVYHPSITKRKN